MPPAGGVHDRDLLDALEAIAPEPLSGTAWRVAWATRDPLIGNSAGGRWHPPNSFEALYVSLEADGAIAEVYHHLSRAPVFSSSHVRLYRLRVEIKQVLRLDDMGRLAQLGIDEAKYRSMDYARSQEIGAAANLLEVDGIIVPCARRSCGNLVLFSERLNLDEALTVEEDVEVNWPAWREQQERPETPG